jgi:type IV secretory pathway VirJ component
MCPGVEADWRKTMKAFCRTITAAVALLLMAIAGMPGVSDLLLPEAQAFRGRGAAFAIGAAAGSAAEADADAEVAAAQQQAAAAQQEAAAAQQQAAAAEAELAAEREKSAAAQQQAPAAPPPAAAGSPLPLGTVVATLPGGCTETPVGGVNYYYCGGNFYKAVYEGSTLKYVTANPG